MNFSNAQRNSRTATQLFHERLSFNNNLLVLLISFKLNGNTLELHPETVLW